MTVKTYHIHTFGCQMNVRESEMAEGVLQKMGYHKVEDIKEASVILFNTCCIRDLAEQKAWGAIGAARAVKQARPDTIIGVFGCLMAQNAMADELRRRFPFVDFCFGSNSIHMLPELLVKSLAGQREYLSAIGDFCMEYGLQSFHQSPPLAYVNIMQGCNNFCTFCIVPYVRGRETSRPADDIVREVENIAAKGYGEVMLLGQNVNSYGTDTNSMNFAKLLSRLDKTGIPRIRFMTSHPKDLSNELINTMAECKSVCKQIHLPVQSGSDDVLKRMNRKYTNEYYRSRIRKLRDAMPDIGITTDFIAGFPGETEADHQASVDLVRDIRFDAAFVFAFSPRKGTQAASMDHQIDTATKKKRLQDLLSEQAEYTKELHENLIGTSQVVLVEGLSKRSERHVSGRMERGRTVNFPGDQSLMGQLVQVRITRANINSLFGEQKTGGLSWQL